MKSLDDLQPITAREAYLAMYEFLLREFENAGDEKTIHLGGLLAELEPESSGGSADEGAIHQFIEAILIVKKKEYLGPWATSDA